MAPEPPLVLTLDLGTSSVRALLFDARGRAVPGIEGRMVHSVRTTPDGGAEIDPEELFAFTLAAVDQAIGRLRAVPGDLAAVAVSTFWHSVMGVNAAGEPVTALYTWADTRCDARDELLARLDEEKVHARTGCVLHASYPTSKLRWLASKLPNVHGRAAWWGSFGEFLFRRLFGRFVTTVSMASGSGLLDVHACAYDAEVLGALGLREEMLSPLTDGPLTGLGGEFARRWPALRDVPWFLPVGDGACNNVGSGAAGGDRLAVMVGTSGAMRVVPRAADVAIPKGLFCYRVDGRRLVLGGALSGGGNVVEWVRDRWRTGSLAEVEAAMADMEPDAHGLTVLPFLAGERSPGWRASARATITGLSLDTTPVEVLRAAMEAVAYRFALVHERLAPAAAGAREIVASGGALLRSPVWLQILADVLDRRVHPCAEGEASSRGAALLALEALGVVKDVAEVPVALGVPVEPEARRHGDYRAALDRHRALYDRLVGT